jgi:hypothetical protein
LICECSGASKSAEAKQVKLALMLASNCIHSLLIGILGGAILICAHATPRVEHEEKKHQRKEGE